MRKERAKKIIDYVSSMVDYYDSNPQRVLRELNERNTEVDQAISKTYASSEGKVFCSECENMKLKDERKDEYYCPRHD